ncbi:MAG: PLDc N-terminal domain-containing protein, partial [Actinobacteria bacterium]|nr:PLDc N-terminal domain-containing protein [Actinomycetota bacterium]
NTYSSSLPVAIQLTYGCGFRIGPTLGGELGITVEGLGYYIDTLDDDFPAGDWRDQPTPPPQEGMANPELAPPDPAIPETAVPGLVQIRTLDSTLALADARAGGSGTPTDPNDRDQNREVTVFGIPLAASWWQLLLGVYGYVLPFVLFGAWATIALWDLLRRDSLTTGRRIGWMAAVLAVPVVGAIVYYAAGGSPIPRALRWFLVAGGLGIYVFFALLGVLLGG